jgi:histidinol phosphatase-like PHP family hydrolase
MTMKIAAIADFHYNPRGNILSPARRGEIADILFLRAVHRINRFIRPDLTVILGDILDAGNTSEAAAGLERIRATAALLKSPWIAIPGNHDVTHENFYSVFPRPAETTDIKNTRFVTFLDPEEPGFNARRTRPDLARMTQARAGWRGQIIALQHTPLFPPGRDECPYNYINADEIIAAMRRNGILLALGGHYHKGVGLIRDDGVNFLAAPALCEAPFSFLEINVSGDAVSVARHDLCLPETLKLWDTHVHTQFAYCSENMEITKTMRLARDFGLAGLTFTEHSGQLYFDNDTYWNYSFLAGGFDAIKKENDRMDAYLAALAGAGCLLPNTGLEADCSFGGKPFVRPADRRRVGRLLGSVHALASLKNPRPDMQKVCDEFLAMTEGLVRSGIDVLAHPFRLFSRAKMEMPERFYDRVVRLLKENNAAAEINFHTQTTPETFIRRCLAAGVKLALGSDAHNLYEIGELSPHLALLRACGFNGDLKEILLNTGPEP